MKVFFMTGLLMALALIILTSTQTPAFSPNDPIRGPFARNFTKTAKGLGKETTKGPQGFGWTNIARYSESPFAAAKQAFGYPAQKAPLAGIWDTFVEHVKTADAKAMQKAREKRMRECRMAQERERFRARQEEFLKQTWDAMKNDPKLAAVCIIFCLALCYYPRLTVAALLGCVAFELVLKSGEYLHTRII